MARRFERQASSFRSFVEKIEEDAAKGETNEAPVVQLMGHYHDTFVRGGDGRWRIHKRAITLG